MSFVDEQTVQDALDFLETNADHAASARADRIYMAEYRKSLKAILMKECPHKSGVIQAREAYADERYLKHLNALREAIFRDEKFQFLRAAAEAKISAWQTWSKNKRPGF